MRLLAISIGVFFICLASNASDLGSYSGKYLVREYAWCNGPHTGAQPGSCSFAGWFGVDVDSIALFTSAQ